jgi:uncharacterized protein YkwD
MLAGISYTASGVNKILITALCACLPLCTALPLQAQQRDSLIPMINAYRAVPQVCDGRRMGPAPALATPRALSNLHIAPGTMLDSLLKRSGYPVAKANVIAISGTTDPAGVMGLLERRYCKQVLDPDFLAAGITQSGNEWQIILAQPGPPPLETRLPDVRQAGSQILEAVNKARASGRQCGNVYFPNAAPVAWNKALAAAAQVHSDDMAKLRFFNHTGKDGRQVAARATAAGYIWRRIGENIAAGQESADEAVRSWLDSPGHCANLMNAGFTDMGSAWALGGDRDMPRIYWTQVFGAPR